MNETNNEGRQDFHNQTINRRKDKGQNMNETNNEENASMAIQAVDMAKEDQRWQEKRIATLARRFRERSNCKCLVEVVHELYELDDRRRKLKDAIEENPAQVSESAKALWPVQLDAMNAYKKALQDRILNLIETDKE